MNMTIRNSFIVFVALLLGPLVAMHAAELPSR